MACEGPDCQKALRDLYLLLDQELDDVTCEQLQAHLDECSNCLSEYDMERLVKALVMRSCKEVAPEPLRQKVLYSIRTEYIRYSQTVITESVSE